MNKQIIEVPYNVRFINDWKDFNINLLSGHSIINKTITGCGFTTYCLTNNIPTILCSPRKFLLENKHDQLKDTYLIINKGEKSLDVDGDDSLRSIIKDPKIRKTSERILTIEEIKNDLRIYLINCQVKKMAPKILVTYDSLKHVLDVLRELIQYYSVIVDEFQNIFIDASFKSDTELNFVSTLQSCPNVTYLSATPYIEEYLNELDEFKDLPYYELSWHPDRLQTIKIDMRKTHNISKEVDKIIQDYLEGHYPEKVDENGVVHQSKEVVFFTNSVKLITSLIRRNNLTPDQVNVICADTEKNKSILENLGIIIGKAPQKGKPHKMFTFCTRTTYAGADFYNNSALSVIVSDCKIDALSTDIRMDFPQIMGRQRLDKNVFKDECIFIYKLSDEDITMEEFERRSKEKLSLTSQDISNFKTVFSSQGSAGTCRMISDFQWRIKTKRYKEDYTGINEKTGEPTINKLVYIAERRAYELRSDVYKNDVQVYNEFAKVTNILPIEILQEKLTLINDLRAEFFTKSSFEFRMKLVCDALLDSRWFGHLHSSDFFWLPLSYRNYLNYLGPEKMKANSYHEADIKRELLSLKCGDIIKESFLEVFTLGERYSLKDLKEIIRGIYQRLNITKTPKATDILNYFEVKECTITDKETKKRINGYEIIKIKE